MTVRIMLRLLAAASILCVAGGACADAVALAQAPTVAGVAPDSGPAAGGASVRIEGTGFTAATAVSFAGVTATRVRVASATSLTAISPPGTGTVDVTVSDLGGSSSATAHDWFAYEPAPGGPWLGLDGNSASNLYAGETLGPVDEFSREGIVYDRSFDFIAGQLPSEAEAGTEGATQFEDRLALDHEHGMIPVSIIEYKGYRGNLTSDPDFPQETRTSTELAEGKTTIAQYVEGFVRSASALLGLVSQRYPGMPVLLEPMNEPWGYTTPRDNGAEYAKVLAQLLPAARAAGIPLTDIYVSAFGADKRLNEHGEPEFFTPGWVPAMYAAEPSLEHEIQGWYFHPYGPASGTEFYDTWGIESVPQIRKQMSSGANNIIVSEVGYCAHSEGGDCNESGQAEVETRVEAAARLTVMLEHALPYYETGWLKALIVYARGDGGWSMVKYPTEQLSPQGEALEAFALAHGKAASQEAPCPSADPFDPGAEAYARADALREPFDAATAGCGEEEHAASEPSPAPAQASSTSSTAPVAGASAQLEPLAASAPSGARSGVELSRPLVFVRGRSARMTLSCESESRCVGLLTLVVKVVSSHHARRSTRSRAIGSATFSLAPGTAAEQLSIRISAQASALVRGRGRRSDGVLAIEQTAPGTHPIERKPVRLVPVA